MAQTTEKRRLQALLFDLCRGLPERPHHRKSGRQPVPIANVIFASAFKVYTGVSARRFGCDLDDAFSKGYLSQPTHPMHACTFLEDRYLTPVLKSLIVQSSWPLGTVESPFAVDSSGFSTSRFEKWFDEKYGLTRKGHIWVKAHIAVGTTTHTITAVGILEKDSGDSPQFDPLLRTTAANFRMSQVAADKAYSSVANLETVADLGGTAYVAFKANASPERGGLWEKMLGYYQYRREEFLKFYHRRSNIESVFSMVKAKFRDHVRSKSDVAMKNEVLCKFLCHNLCVLIQSQCQLGIEPVFWENEADEPQDVLPMTRRV